MGWPRRRLLPFGSLFFDPYLRERLGLVLGLAEGAPVLHPGPQTGRPGEAPGGDEVALVQQISLNVQEQRFAAGRVTRHDCLPVDHVVQLGIANLGGVAVTARDEAYAEVYV